MTASPLDILGLFPTLNPAVFGGVEEAGRVAWSSIRQSRGADRCQLLCYSPGSLTESSPGDPNQALCAGSKAAAVRLALTRKWTARTVFVWHLALLRLLPFMRLGRTRVVVFLHGVEAWRPHDWVTHRLLKRVDLFLSNSQYTWERFVTVHPRYRNHSHRTVHLGLGMPMTQSSPASDMRPVAAMIGRMDRTEDYKGHREMIGAWPLITARIPSAELWVLGSGDLQTTLAGVAEKNGVGDRVRFFGRVSEEKKQEVLGDSRCLCLPSRGEGFGLVYLEAMRHSRPCLVSTIDAGREVVNPPESGLAVDPDSPQEIASAACRLLDGGTEWTELSDRARRRYESQFTAAQFQRRLLEALCL